MREKRRTIGVLPFFPLAAILSYILVHHMLNAGDRARCGEASAPCLRGCAGQPVFVAENRAWLLKDDAGMYALSAVCSHLGCTVRWEAGAFRCPCHSSRYAWTWSGAARSSNPAAAHGVGGHRRCRPPGGGPGQAGGGCIPADCVGVKSLAGWLFWFSGPPWFKGARQCSEPGGSSV